MTVTTATGDRSEIDRLVAVLRTSRHGSDISNKAADWIENLAHAEFEAVVKLNSTPPDHLALVAAAYRDAADACADCAPAPAGGPFSHTNSMRVIAADCQNAVSRRTPADAEAHLTALLRAEYERGVREAADKCNALRDHEDTTDEEARGAMFCASDILALLTQERR